MSTFSKTAMHAASSKSVMHKLLYRYFQPSDSHKQSALRNHLVAASGEFIGTYTFLLLAFLGHSAAIKEASSTASTSGTFYIALSYSFSYLVNIQLMYAISGGCFNPVVTFALALCGELPPLQGIIFFPVQFLGSVLAAETAMAIIPGDVGALQAALATNVHVVQGLLLEMLLTAVLVFAVLILLAQSTRSNFLLPIGIGLTYFVTQLAGIAYTGASLNPLRSVAPCISSGDFPSYHWIYWVGPFLGSLLASSYYHFVRYVNYWAVDKDEESLPPCETTPLLQTGERLTQSPGPASPRSRRQTLAESSQRDTNDSQERGGDSRKQHHPHYPYYRYRRDGHFDLNTKQEIGRRFSDGRIFERAQRQDQIHESSFDGSEQVRKGRGKDKIVAVDV